MSIKRLQKEIKILSEKKNVEKIISVLDTQYKNMQTVTSITLNVIGVREVKV